MEDQFNTPTEAAASTIVVTITPQGVQPPVIHTDTAKAQAQMEKVRDLIQPCLEIADAIVKRADLGATG